MNKHNLVFCLGFFYVLGAGPTACGMQQVRSFLKPLAHIVRSGKTFFLRHPKTFLATACSMTSIGWLVKKNSLLRAAISNGNRKTSWLMRLFGARFNIHHPHAIANLINAIITGNQDAVTLMLDQGLDANTQDNQGRSLLALALMHRNKAIARLLVNRGAHVDNNNHFIRTLFNIAATDNDQEAMLILLDAGFDINNPDTSGLTPLIETIQKGSAESTEFLIEHNADVHCADNKGKTALIHAIDRQFFAKARILLEHGATIDDTYEGAREMHDAIAENNETLAYELIHKGIYIHRDDKHKNSTILNSIELGQFEKAQKIIATGTRINHENLKGHALLIEAIKNHDMQRFDLLLQAGINLSGYGADGSHAVTTAMGCYFDHKVIGSYFDPLADIAFIHRLIHEHGARINPEDKRAIEHLINASIHNDDRIVQLLIDAGINI